MKMTAVRSLVFEKGRYQNKAFFQKFMEMNTKEVELDFEPHEYANARTAYMSLRCAAKRLGFPVYVALIDGKVHLYREDM